MSITRYAAIAAFTLVATQAFAQAQPQTFDDSVTGGIQNRFEALVGAPSDGRTVVAGPTERRVGGVREVLIRNSWMVAPNN